MPLGPPVPFYFNGERMPDWGAAWGYAGISTHLEDENWGDEHSHRDVWIIDCRIDHMETVESADPQIMLYVVQEVLLILLEKEAEVLGRLAEYFAEPRLVHGGLVQAAFEMQRLIQRDQCAFWTSGTEEWRARCVEWMRCSSLPQDDPDYRKAPHEDHRERDWKIMVECQRNKLRALAQSGRYGKEMRRALHEI